MDLAVHVPDRPAVHAVVPAFRWTRTAAERTVSSLRETSGVRVWLERPWLGELLGVVIPASPQADEQDRPLHDLLTRCDGDIRTQGSALVNLVDPAAAGEDPVRIAGHAVRFDEPRGLWYADVDLDARATCVRLALVRLQGGRVSPVAVAGSVALPPRRELVARRRGRSGVRVTVSGPAQPDSRFVARPERAVEGFKLRVEPARPGVLAELVLDCEPAPAGRIVVEELQPGWALLGPDAGERVVYSERF